MGRGPHQPSPNPSPPPLSPSGLLFSIMIYLGPMEQETIGIPPQGVAKSQRIWARSGSQGDSRAVSPAHELVDKTAKTAGS